VAALALAPGSLKAGGNDFRAAVTGASRELSRQLFFFQNTLSLIPGPPMGRGLYKQCDDVQGDLIYFQQQLARNVSREQLLLNFDKMDAKLNQLMGDIKNFENWDTALRTVANRVRAADHDLHFALTSGSGAPAGGPELAYRQTLALLTKSENFAGMVRYVFDEQAGLAQWNADLATLKKAIGNLQNAEKNKAAAEDVKNQLLATDQAWEKLVARLKALPQGQYVLLQSDAAQVDRVLFRLAQIVGIKIGRAPLPDPLAF
jgi:hypothetical protein